ncbi:efflux RND transporter periplasmic adaptor subunit [Salinisphaera sp. T31B1]|uniref:efflux RND transporter periplasmic adaptor subunit n=1 Tax=Salinisphaera sp. T31B1 TaxID=727963 RepID=UPI00333F974B
MCVVVGLIALAGCGNSDGQQGGQAQQSPPIPVDVKAVQPHSVDVFSEYPGRVEGKRTVQVLARVEGILEKRHYEEGQIVKKGQLLYTIDPKPFQATVNQRKAELASAKASLDQAQRQWSRVRQLYKVDAVSEAERDQALSELETSRAAVQQAQANLDSAQIDLSYTKVNAPLTGVTSLRETDEGSLVSNGTRLTTITQLDPVYVLFALPEDDAIARNKALSMMGGESTDDKTREATIILPNGDTFPVTGTVDFTQSTINPDTGTVQLRAVVENTGNALMPGRYVRARIRLETRQDALVVPNVAVSDSQQSTQVYVVSDDNKAKAVKVELGPNVADGRIINKGLSAGDRVIVSGLGQVQPDAPVKVKQGGDNQGDAPANGAQGDSSSMGARGDNRDDALAAVDWRELRLSGAESLSRRHGTGYYASNRDQGR